MIIIAREELSRAAAGFTGTQHENAPFHRWMAADMSAAHDHEDAPLSPKARPAPDLYKNRLWRCE